MKRSSCLIGIVSLALAYAVSAAVTPTYVTTATQGKWCNSASSVQAAANKNNIPVVMILTMTGCAYCAGFNGHVFTTEAFQNWSTSSKYYLCRVQAVAGNFTSGEPKVAVAWTGGGDAPRIMAYWKKKDGTVIKKVVSGQKSNDPQYWIKWFDGLFAGYSEEELDKWDPTDDTPTGATAIDPVDVLGVESEKEHGPHVLSAESKDLADWFKMPVQSGRRYRVALKDYSCEGTAPTVVVSNGVSATVVNPSIDQMKSGYVFTPGSDGDVYVAMKTESATTRATYKLAYREYSAISIDFSSPTYNVKEDVGSAEVTIERSGRLSDPAKFRIWTEDGTAVSPTHYAAFTNEVTLTNYQYEARIPIPIMDVGGVQELRSFKLHLENLAEGGVPPVEATVTIEDVDNPYDKFDKQKPGDTGDETWATATEYAMLAIPSNGKDIDGMDRVVSSKDLNDWFVFTNALKGGCTYQVRVNGYGKRPSSETGDPLMRFYSGRENAEAGDDLHAFANPTLKGVADLGYWRFKWPVEMDGESLYLQVTNTTQSSAIFNYSLEWREWILPIIGFETNEMEVVSADGVATSVNIPIWRWNNLEEDIYAKVEVLSSDPRVRSVTNEVKFAKSTKATIDDKVITLMPLAIGKDAGLWLPDAKFTVRILEDEAVHLPPTEDYPHLLTVTLRTSMPERDVENGEPANDSPTGAEKFEMSRRPTTTSRQTLNGEDTSDWMEFDVEGGKEYVFRAAGLASSAEGEGELPVSVTFIYPSADPMHPSSTNLSITTLAREMIKLRAEDDGVLKVHFEKTDSEPPSIAYALMYREYVPTVVYFATNAIQVSEYASNVSIPVHADMEVPLPVDVRVLTSDGTAKAGEDYVAKDERVSWSEGELVETQTNYVKYVSIDLKKTVSEYEGNETFDVLLDLSDSVALLSDEGYDRITVTIIEADKGNVGSFCLGERVAGGVTNETPTKALAVFGGETVKVRVYRTGNAKPVTATLKWKSSGKVAATVEFGDLETEKWVDVTVPASEGAYTAKYTDTLTLTTNVKDAKVVRGTCLFSIADRDTTLAAYRSGLSNLPFNSGGNQWFMSGDTVRSQTLSAGASASMYAVFKGSGTVSFTPSFAAAGEIAVKVGSKTVEPQVEGDRYSVPIPAGSVRLTIVFTARADGAWVSVDDFTFTPDVAFCRTGNFVGCAVRGDACGQAAVTVAKSGGITGSLKFPGNVVYTLVGKLGADGRDEEVSLRRAGKKYAGELSIDEQGYWEMSVPVDGGAVVEAWGSRNGWADRPLTGFFAAHEDLLGQTLSSDAELGGVPVSLTFKVGASGAVKTAGRIGSRAISASNVPFAVKDGTCGQAAFVLLPSGETSGVPTFIVPCGGGLYEVVFDNPDGDL